MRKKADHPVAAPTATTSSPSLGGHINMDHCVYLHRRKTDGKVFYVGKGYRKRAKSIHGRNKHWINTVKKHGYTIEIVIDGIQDWYAIELEISLISLYGRKDQGKGILVNMTDGGEGFLGGKRSQNTKNKISNALTGRKHSPEVIKRISEARRGRFKGANNASSKRVKIVFNNGTSRFFDSNLEAANVLNLDFRNFSAVKLGKRKMPKAWSIERIEDVE